MCVQLDFRWILKNNQLLLCSECVLQEFSDFCGPDHIERRNSIEHECIQLPVLFFMVPRILLNSMLVVLLLFCCSHNYVHNPIAFPMQLPVAQSWFHILTKFVDLWMLQGFWYMSRYLYIVLHVFHMFRPQRNIFVALLQIWQMHRHFIVSEVFYIYLITNIKCYAQVCMTHTLLALTMLGSSYCQILLFLLVTYNRVWHYT